MSKAISGDIVVKIFGWVLSYVLGCSYNEILISTYLVPRHRGPKTKLPTLLYDFHPIVLSIDLRSLNDEGLELSEKVTN